MTSPNELTTSPPPAPEPFGEHYRVLGPLGQGGSAKVVEVEHIHLGKRFAIKVLHMGDGGSPTMRGRFLSEAQVLGRLDHPSIVQVSDIGVTADGNPFVVMERLYGRTLHEELRRRGPLPAQEAFAIMKAVLDGLSAAHAIGVVHRDIKPENIFLCDARGWNEGGERPVKILDFGIAKVLPHSTHVPPPAYQSREGATIGTPRYLSPEQALCMPVDERTDLYGAGLVLYAMVAGQGPFDCWAGDMAAILDAHVHEVPRPPSAHVSTISPALDAVVLRALAKDPADRFASAKDFADAIAAALAPTVAANEDRPAGLWTRLQRAQMSLTAAVLLVLGCTAFSLLVTFLVVGRAR